jgi:hypothetical protein
MSDLVVIARFYAKPEAMIACSVLESEGLYAFVPDFNILGAEFDPALTSTGYRLLVREEDEAEAMDILRAVLASD